MVEASNPKDAHTHNLLLASLVLLLLFVVVVLVVGISDEKKFSRQSFIFI